MLRRHLNALFHLGVQASLGSKIPRVLGQMPQEQIFL